VNETAKKVQHWFNVISPYTAHSTEKTIKIFAHGFGHE